MTERRRRPFGATCFQGFPMLEGVSHGSLWQAMVASVRDPARVLGIAYHHVEDFGGFVRRARTTRGETCWEHVYTDEASREIVTRRLVDGAADGVESVAALHASPLRIDISRRDAGQGA